MSVSAIIPAAGSGTRMNHHRKKPYIRLHAKPILAHTLKRISSASAISEIIIAVHPGEERFCKEEILTWVELPCPVNVIAGGDTRQESVRLGLSCLNEHSGYVLIHDGARPLIPGWLVKEIIRLAAEKKAVTAAVPVKDTVAAVSLDTGRIARVLPRETIFAVQTPQCFEKKLIMEAHRKAAAEGFHGTDDASLVMRLGVDVFAVKGVYDNIKITTPEDIVIAESILERQPS